MDRETEIWAKHSTNGNISWSESAIIAMREFARERSIGVLRELIEDCHAAMDKGATGNELLYSLNDFIFDLEEKIESITTK